MNLSLKHSIWFRELSFNLFALVIIFLIPLLSRSLQIPFYYIDPMRLMVILAIAHTRRHNPYVLALVLPLFSYLISSHPSMFKMLSIMAELLLNVWLFFYLWKRMRTIFVAMLASIILSKMFYYLIKFLLIQVDLIQTGLFSTPWIAQMIMAISFSLYVWIILSFIRKNPTTGNSL
jgi:hypothetical protein